MAKNEKKSSGELDAQRDAQAREAKKKLKEAEKAGTDAKKEKAEKAPKAKKFRRFWKDFRGELKKIVWPDFKTVLKNTGIVLLTTLIIGVPVWILDYGLSEGVTGMKKLAKGAKTTQAETAAPGDEFNLEDYLSQLGDITEPAQGTTAEAQAVTGLESEGVTQPAEPVTEPAAEPVTEPEEEPVTATEPAE
ncbi:MAG: preprotein translocase subunit SecE [Oscillospiraceae bacterium]|jgi:preprotein translocase subunit SecE|nr:preprotein translocase subunit SecE [Oscillospiraceae bacterium]